MAGFAVAVASGSRPLGGVVLLAGGVLCARIWWLRHGWRRTLALAGADFSLFVISHGLGALIGAWPAVLLVAAVLGWIVWRWSDGQARSEGEIPAGTQKLHSTGPESPH